MERKKNSKTYAHMQLNPGVEYILIIKYKKGINNTIDLLLMIAFN